MAADASLFNQAANDQQRQATKRRMLAIARLIAERWEGEPEAADAWTVLLQDAIADGRLEKAAACLERIPPASTPGARPNRPWARRCGRPGSRHGVSPPTSVRPKANSINSSIRPGSGWRRESRSRNGKSGRQRRRRYRRIDSGLAPAEPARDNRRRLPLGCTTPLVNPRHVSGAARSWPGDSLLVYIAAQRWQDAEAALEATWNPPIRRTACPQARQFADTPRRRTDAMAPAAPAAGADGRSGGGPRLAGPLSLASDGPAARKHLLLLGLGGGSLRGVRGRIDQQRRRHPGEMESPRIGPANAGDRRRRKIVRWVFKLCETEKNLPPRGRRCGNEVSLGGVSAVRGIAMRP